MFNTIGTNTPRTTADLVVLLVMVLLFVFFATIVAYTSMQTRKEQRLEVEACKVCAKGASKPKVCKHTPSYHAPASSYHPG